MQHNNELKNKIDDLKDLNDCLKENNVLLKENNSFLKEKSTLDNAPVWCNLSYKQSVLKKPVNKVNVPNLLIYTHNNMSLDTALINIKNLVNKKKDIHINKIIKTKKFIVMKCFSIDDNNKILQMVNDNEDLGITAKIEELKKPRIRLVGSDTDVGSWSNDEIIQDIKARNELTEEHEIEVVFKYKNKAKNTWNIIFEVNGLAYSNIMVNKKIFFDCTVCPIYNDFDISFCTKCCKYWHKAKKCRNIDTTICTTCSENHLDTNCSNSTSPQCNVCLDYNRRYKDGNRKTNHSAMDIKNCDSYAAILNHVISTTDYLIDPLLFE